MLICGDPPHRSTLLTMIALPRKLVSITAVVAVVALGCSESDTAGPGAGGDDRTPPERIVDARLSYPTAGGGASLTWTAPRDDESHDVVDRYEIRFSYSAPFEWEMSLPVSDPPSPVREGGDQTYVFPDPKRGRDLHAAIRSFDQAGNASRPSEAARVHVAGIGIDGVCRDAMTGRPLSGLSVEITERRVHQLVSDEQGRYSLDDAAAGVINISIRSGAHTSVYHPYHFASDVERDVSLDHLMIEYQEADNAAVDNVLLLLLSAAGFTDDRPRLKKWWSYPIPVYVPPFVNDREIDYEDHCKRATRHWNDVTGLEIFVLVDAPPDDGVTMSFKTRAEMAPHNGLTGFEEDDGRFPVSAFVEIIDDFPDGQQLWTVALHELGHAIRIEHLPDGYLMYGGRPLPDTPTPDEIKMVQLYLALPNDLDMTVFDPADPR